MTPRSFVALLWREVWEHPSVWVAPLATAGVILLAYAVGLRSIGETVTMIANSAPAAAAAAMGVPLQFAAATVLVVGWVVAIFYSLDALHTERRDRSILFWKSMPVSDVETVLAKFTIAIIVVPSVCVTVAFATQMLLAIGGAITLAAKGVDLAPLWPDFPLVSIVVRLVYGTAVHMLWYAPIAGLLLLVSAWAKRSPFLWLLLVLAVVPYAEFVIFSTGHVLGLFKYRVVGAMHEAFSANFVSTAAGDAMRMPQRLPGSAAFDLSTLAPMKFLATPGLWLGLLFAAACVFGATWLRRRRDPI